MAPVAITHAGVLGVTHGGRVCPPVVAAALLAQPEAWNPKDVPESLDGPKEDVMVLWRIILAECFDNAAEPLADAELQRFKLWVFTKEDAPEADDKSEDGDVSLKDGNKEHSSFDKPSGKAKPATEEDEDVSPAVRMELSKQGMTRTSQLKYLSACMYLGTHASARECSGLVVGEHVGTNEVIRKACKVQGFTTLITAVEEAKKINSRSPLDSFFAYLATSMTTAIDDHASYAPMGAARIRSFYNLLCDTAKSDMTVILFIEDTVSRSYRGRGCPTDIDMQKLAVIEKRAEARDAPTDRSSGGVAKQKEMDGDLKAIAEQMKEVVSVVGKVDGIEARITTKLNSAIMRLEGKVEALGAKVSRIEDGSDPEKDKYIKCNFCKKKGHREANCPDK